ncbi:MAG: IMG dehydrogenase/GMP reductase family protein [Candidatus Beckwithbacteria bacterium GW2011_GWC2_47_9]|uniref:IMG dehydrogenase/GMP reductase family protein n=2 Tax=Candidatus Beckwithiibacteriota TaxID=1752726 RepID=A0A0G1WAG7_9BACT|nr:MAG: IMG dehydrogenase/GMP reductase family protein [Candidatus Beckwithbacteria bacterium GW2011_GWC2_47_9]OGD61692.1 MAG: guanosine monophosphate reductase [Candidatus Beckwithbacteria bacterium RIFCSPLOWO2_02_FULL_47_23]
MTKLYLTYDDVLLLPNYSEVTPSRTDLEDKIPIIASPMDTVCEKEMALALGKLGGYGIIHRNLPIVKQADQIAWVLKQKVNCGAAVGVGPDFEERVKALINAGAKEICVDSAHGHTKHVIEAIRRIKTFHPGVEIIAGNVATYEGAKDLFNAGADVVKVGMGPGSICTTRIMSGMGVPQLTAVIDCVRAAKKYKKKIIADGGIKTSGDIVKALAAGADSVMLGSLLAGTDEAPGKLVTIKGKKFKTYRGMGSSAAMKLGSASRYGQEKAAKKFVSEGVEGLVEYQGKLAEVVFQLIGGLRSGMAYLGAKNLRELKQKAKFIQISPAAWAESKPHSLYEQK